MILKSLIELPPAEEQLVIINVNTKLATTLALLSAIRYAEMPILVVDCESGDGSYAYFANLSNTFDFDLISAPLRAHGVTLDWLFSHLSSKKVLLMDSDIELLDSEITARARQFIDGERVFGCGFVHEPEWVHGWLPGQEAGLSIERFWVPFVMLKTSFVQEAIQSGCSFLAKVVYNDFPPWQFASKILLLLRYRFSNPPWSRVWNLLIPFRNSFYGHKPSWVNIDTGAQIHQYLKYRRAYHFVGLPVELMLQHLTHFGGITRRVVDPGHLFGGMALVSVEDAIRNRLKYAYQFSPP